MSQMVSLLGQIDGIVFKFKELSYLPLQLLLLLLLFRFLVLLILIIFIQNTQVGQWYIK
jgi:hypothetical protein